MTTFDLRSALRHALTTLVGSPPWSGGLLPNPIDKDLAPEERLAARLVRRFNLRPTIDVEALARQLAEVTDKRFPSPIDGLCLDLKLPGKQPKIWIAENAAPVRRRFTLAHEIGHIVIPWHTGSIVDDVDAPRRATGRYRIMEAEANRFAAELLMPSEWVRSLSERSEHIATLMTTIQRVADVSFGAAVIRALKYGRPGFIVARVENGVVAKTDRTRGTRSNPPVLGTLSHLIDLPTSDQPSVISHGDVEYYCWRVDNAVTPGQRPTVPWRTALDNILLRIPFDFRERTRASINAIVGNALGQTSRGTSVQVIYGQVLASTKNRAGDNPFVRTVIEDPDFESYVLGRCYERSNL